MFERGLNRAVYERGAAAFVLSIAILCVYYPVLHFDFLYHDDWILFNAARSTCDASPMHSYIKIRGLPLGAYVHCGLFRLFHTIHTAWVARLAIVGGIAAFAFVQSIYFRALGIGWMAAILLALGTSVLPGVLVSGYWITPGAGVFALLPSAAAALLTAAALQRRTGVAWRVAFLVGACGLEVISLLMSQVSAMYFWTLTAVMLATALARAEKSVVRPLAVYAIVGSAPMAGYFIWFEYLSGYPRLLEIQDPIRGTLFADLAGNLRWFFETALPRASLLWFFDLPSGLGAAALAVFASSSILFCAHMCWIVWRRGDLSDGLVYAAYPLLLVAFCVLAALPVLVTNFRVPVFRSLVSLSALIFLTGAIHLGKILRVERWPSVIQVGGAVGLALGLCVLAGHSLINRMVLPAAAEYAYVRSSLLDAARSGRTAAMVHAIVPVNASTFRTTTDEVDHLSVQFIQDVEPLIRAVQHELGMNLWVSLSPQGAPFPREHVFILDFVELSKRGLWKSVLGGAPSSQPVRLRAYGNNYVLFSFRGLIHAVPRRPNQVDWEEEISTRDGVITGATVDEVISRLPVDETIDPQPILVQSHRGYNLVSYRGLIYALPMALGPTDLRSTRVDGLPGVFVERTVEAALLRLPG